MMEQTKKQTVISALIIGLKLLLICAIIAGIVAFVYDLTREQYDQNQEALKAEAIGKIFVQTEGSMPLILKALDEAKTVNAVYDGQTLLGYSVEVIEKKAYNGPMTLMVGFDADKKVIGIKIVSHTETPGLGSKVDDEGHLSKFLGRSEQKEYEPTDGITGATFSSKAVVNGINQAIENLAKAMDATGGEAN